MAGENLMLHKIKRLLKWLAVALAAYLGLVLIAFAWQMIHGRLRNPDADLVKQDMQPAITRIVESAREIVSVNRGPEYRRDAHSKPHGCVRADMEVLQNEEKYRYGIFAKPKKYETWVRFSNGTVPQVPDYKKDARGMAIKVMGVEGEQLLPPELAGGTQDFLMINAPRFFVRRIDEYVELMHDAANEVPFKYFFGGYSVNPFKWKLRQLYIAQSTRTAPPVTPFSTQYFSMSPYKLGPHDIKFSSKSCDVVTVEGINQKHPNLLRESMKKVLQKQDVCMELMVQIRKPDARMPIEDTTVTWSEKESPFVTVARLSFPRQDFDTPEQNRMCEDISMNPWHAIKAHEPISKINEMRKELYLHTAAFRRMRNGVIAKEAKEPASWCDSLEEYCPKTTTETPEPPEETEDASTQEQSSEAGH
jgi:hypothetical protein